MKKILVLLIVLFASAAFAEDNDRALREIFRQNDIDSKHDEEMRSLEKLNSEMYWTRRAIEDANAPAGCSCTDDDFYKGVYFGQVISKYDVSDVIKIIDTEEYKKKEASYIKWIKHAAAQAKKEGK